MKFNNKGYALAITIIILAIVPLLGTTLLSALISEIKMNKAIEHTAIVKYLAEAGVEHGIYVLEQHDLEEDLYFNTSKSWNKEGKIYSYSVEVIFNEENMDILINSTGRLRRDRKTLKEHSINATVNQNKEIIRK